MKLTPNWMFAHFVLLTALTYALLHCILGSLYDLTCFLFGDF